jgi:hypothetical protein
MQHLNDYSFERLRLAVPVWTVNTLQELLGKIKATMRQYGKTMPEQESNDLIRKWAIIRHELAKRLKANEFSNFSGHKYQEKMIRDTRETAFKDEHWRRKR